MNRPRLADARPLLALIALAMITLASSGCTQFDALNAFVPKSGYTRRSNLAYGQLPRQTLDAYRPSNARPNTPIVVFFYGGWWQTGRKEDYRFVAQALASRGFIAVLPDYRLYPDVIFPTFVEDGAAAVKWTHDHASELGGDPKHLYVMGHSAGAHIAALLTLDEHYLHDVGLDRSAIRATATLAGPYDFTPKPQANGVFGPPSAAPDPRIEPINFVDGREPPMLLITGLKDQTVEPENALHLADRIRQRHGDVTLITYPKAGHVIVVLSLAAPFRWTQPVLDDVTKFFHAHE